MILKFFLKNLIATERTKQRNEKKIIKNLKPWLSISTISNSVMSVSAYELDAQNNSIESVEYQNSDDADFSNATNVFAELGSQFKVTIPKIIVLSGTTKDAKYYVKVVGDIAGNESVNVVPDSTFLLNAKNKDAQVASVKQDKTIWKYANLGTNAYGDVKAPTITAGKWQGTFNFDINLSKNGSDFRMIDNQQKATLSAGDSTKLDISNIEAEGVTFASSNPEVVTVDSEGNVTAVGTGTATIIVNTPDGKTQEVIINVAPEKEIELANGNVSRIEVEEEVESIESSDPSVFTVDEDGNIKATGKGTAKAVITRKDGTKKEILVTVKDEDVKVVDMENETPASVYIENGNVLKLESSKENVTFVSKNPEIATIDENGNVKAIKTGTATIIVKDEEGNEKEVVVTVEDNQPVVVEKKVASDIIVEPAPVMSLLIETGDAKAINVADSAAFKDKEVTYTSKNPEIVTVDEKGNVKAVGKGTATVVVTADDGTTREIEITVEPSDNIIVNASSSSLTLPQGNNKKLELSSIAGKDVDNAVIKSSNEEVVTVDKDGNIVAVGEGSAVITITTPDGFTKEVMVNVPKTEVAPVTIDKGGNASVSVESGNMKKIELASISGLNLTGAEFTSSNPEIATVDENGNVKALKEGTVTVTVSLPDGTTKDVTVNVKPAEKLELEIDKTTSEVVVPAGSSTNLNISSSNGTLKNPVFVSSNEEVATVDKDGNVIAKNVGVTTVTIKSDNGTDKQVTITVEKADNIVPTIDGEDASNVRFEQGSEEKINIASSNSMQLTNPVFVSSNPDVVTVDSQGNVKAVGKGTATITIKSDNSVEKQITVTVDDKDSITSSMTDGKDLNVSIEDGSTKVINLGESKDLTYKSSNTNVATVDKDGNITPKNVGKTVVTVKDNDGNIKNVVIDVKPTDNIQVSTASGKVEELNISDSTKIELSSKDTLVIKNPTFTSKDESIVKVDNAGNVTAVGEGTTKIVIKSANSKDKEMTVTVSHKAKAAVKENNVAPTCEKDGSYQMVEYCQYCNKELSRKTTTVAKLGHDYVEGKCTRCGDTLPALSVSANGFTGTYDGKAHAISVTSSGNTIQYSTDNKTWQNANPTYTNAGTYTVYYKVSKDGYKTVTGSANVVINKANSAVKTAPTAKSLTYSGSAQQLVNAGSATNGSMQYSTDNKTWSTTIPSGTNAGSYTVYYKVVGNANYNDVASKSVAVTVAKKAGSVTAPTAKSLTYNGSAQALVNAGSTNAGTLQYSADNKTWGTTIPTGTNAGIYTVYYKVVGNTNYNDVASKSISVNIAKKATSISATGSGALHKDYEKTGTETYESTEITGYKSETVRNPIQVCNGSDSGNSWNGWGASCHIEYVDETVQVPITETVTKTRDRYDWVTKDYYDTYTITVTNPAGGALTATSTSGTCTVSGNKITVKNVKQNATVTIKSAAVTNYNASSTTYVVK